jgi:hypothetical protein
MTLTPASGRHSSPITTPEIVPVAAAKAAGLDRRANTKSGRVKSPILIILVTFIGAGSFPAYPERFKVLISQ